MILLSQHALKVNKPICPTLIHDDATRLLVIWILLPITIYILYRILKYYDNP